MHNAILKLIILKHMNINQNNLFYKLPLELHQYWLSPSSLDTAFSLSTTSRAGYTLINNWSLQVFKKPFQQIQKTLQDRVIVNLIASCYDLKEPIHDEGILIEKILIKSMKENAIGRIYLNEPLMKTKVLERLYLTRRFLIEQKFDSAMGEQIEWIKKIIDATGCKMSSLKSLKALINAVKHDRIVCDGIIEEFVEPKLNEINNQSLLLREYNKTNKIKSWEQFQMENRNKFVEHKKFLRSLLAYRSFYKMQDITEKVQDFMETSKNLENITLMLIAASIIAFA